MKIIQQTNMTSTQTMGYTVVSKTGHVLVIDGGYTGNDGELKRVINSVGGHVHLWLITHPHDDHYTAVIDVLKNPEGITYDCLGSTWLPDQDDPAIMESDRKELYDWNHFAAGLDHRYFELKEGQVFKLGSMKVEVLAGANPEIKSNFCNNQSCAIRVTEDDFTMLFLGDMGVEAGRKLMAKGYNLKADAVQMAHHGQQGVEEEVYQTIAPTFAFWSTPDWLWNNVRNMGDPIGSGPFATLEVRAWMEKLNTVNITSMEHTIMFDTDTRETVKY